MLPRQLEYYLLTGRYYVMAGDTESAIINFKKVIESGANAGYYFASDAALRLGSVYEAERRFQEAKKYYQLAGDLYKSDYYEYIDDKAEKGLRRVKQALK